jgi:hypothetical protein
LRAVAVVGAVSFLLGVLLLAYGLWRARAVQLLTWWPNSRKRKISSKWHRLDAILPDATG